VASQKTHWSTANEELRAHIEALDAKIAELEKDSDALRRKNIAYIAFIMAEGLQEEYQDWMECDLSSQAIDNAKGGE
jgi:hypothetical protein